MLSTYVLASLDESISISQKETQRSQVHSPAWANLRTGKGASGA